MESDNGAADVNESSNWIVAAASVIGASHETANKPCQDFNMWQELPDGWLVAAVADGAGSAPLGEVGSEVATKAVVEAVQAKESLPSISDTDDIWNELLTDVIKEARRAVKGEASDRGVSLKDMSTTLIVALTAPGFAALAQVGDGSGIISDRDKNITGLLKPQPGEYINEVTFLTSDAYLSAMQTSVWRGDLGSLALLTDGMQMLALEMPEGTPFPPFFRTIFDFVAGEGESDAKNAELAAFLASKRVRERTSDDVTMLVAVWPHSSNDAL